MVFAWLFLLFRMNDYCMQSLRIPRIILVFCSFRYGKKDRETAAVKLKLEVVTLAVQALSSSV